MRVGGVELAARRSALSRMRAKFSAASPSLDWALHPTLCSLGLLGLRGRARKVDRICAFLDVLGNKLLSLKIGLETLDQRVKITVTRY
jgi:hypothetical protein